MSYSYIHNAHPGYIDAMYKKYQENPAEVPAGWAEFFQGFNFALSQKGLEAQTPEGSVDTSHLFKEFSVLQLISQYRQRGHLISDTNPVRQRKNRFPHLDLQDFGLNETDLETKFMAGAEIGMNQASLKEIIAKLKKIYAAKIGFEYAHLENLEKRTWLKSQIESFTLQNSFGLTIDQKKRILEKLNGAVGFENFLAKKYVAQKRFGLEGGESTIAGLDAIICTGATLGVKEVVIGMAHRGRLNVLANIMGKTYEHIFNEFQDVMPEQTFGDGDVKYHLGYSSEMKTPAGQSVYLKLVPNPSHLEAVNPVVEGFARAKADLLYNSNYDEIMPILIHGDAAAAGQGIMYEVAQMSQLEGYYTGGTIHFVINNQIGFTTDFEDARTSTYATGVASVIQAPVFHVNGDDPEAVVFACQLAARYRQEFNSDIFIDMVCYRKHGHNEGDDPQFTQPQLYKKIKDHKDPRAIYVQQLIQRGEIEANLAAALDKEFDSFLQERFDLVKQKPLPYKFQEPELAWEKMKKVTSTEDYEKSPDTYISLDQVKNILSKLQNIPSDFHLLPKFKRILSRTDEFIQNETCDWSMAEHLAYGSLLIEGKDVRMSGQDVKRGTFSHRNAVLYDAETNKQYNRLNHIGDKQGSFRIFNSLLSEFAVLGFEYGYSIATPDSLVIWEAQFGDFVNGAQTIIDQFISSSESKWGRMSGLVMLLPHGYEGQGPEHSSARLERFLQSCAEFNLTVANVTTPANFFHLMRRQLARPFRKPLIVMSPKSLLRHPSCISNFKDFTQGGFQEVIDAPLNGKEADQIKKVILCSGKVYYDLLSRKEETKSDEVAIIRLEQIYPFPKTQVDELIKKYKKAKFLWVQEEPSNMGAWQYILAFYRNFDIQLVARKSSASPATGYKKLHVKELNDILDRAVTPITTPTKVS